jgi:membrane associated rhomboid family serine protease
MPSILVKIIQSPVATFIFAVTIATTVAAFQNQWLKEKLILRPYAFAHRKQYFTIITSGLIHADWQHLIMNMFTFWMFAFHLEKTITYLQCVHLGEYPDAATQRLNEFVGHAKFLLIYIISMIIADLTTILKYKDIPGYASLGASGAIAGIVMATVILSPAMDQHIMIMGFIPGWVFAILYLTYSYFAAQRMMDNVAHEAHLWGAVSGIVFTFILMPRQSWKFVEMLQHTFYGWLG